MDKKSLAGMVATAAAIAFVAAPFTASIAQAASADKVKCYGVNSCKGKSACKTAQNECKGKNACKGKGYKMETEKACTKMKGSMTEPAAS